MNEIATRRLLAASLALSAGCAHAVSLNPNGLGQVLIYPYYTVNAGQQTLLSVVNGAVSSGGVNTLANYTAAYRHRATTSCTNAAGTCAQP